MKWMGHDTDHSPPLTAEVKKWWSYYLYSHHKPSWCVQGQLHPFAINNCNENTYTINA
jgi:hypothetical protein